jgi:hypothetical protein
MCKRGPVPAKRAFCYAVGILSLSTTFLLVSLLSITLTTPAFASGYFTFGGNFSLFGGEDLDDPVLYSGLCAVFFLTAFIQAIDGHVCNLAFIHMSGIDRNCNVPAYQLLSDSMWKVGLVLAWQQFVGSFFTLAFLLGTTSNFYFFMFMALGAMAGGLLTNMSIVCCECRPKFTEASTHSDNDQGTKHSRNASRGYRRRSGTYQRGSSGASEDASEEAHCLACGGSGED